MRKSSRLPLEALRPYLLELSSANESPLVDWQSVFENDRPIEVEVGCGKGGWLVEAAQSRSEHNFLGIEVVRALQLYVATRLAKRSLKNAKVACTDARNFFAHRAPPASVHAVHVYFPDPWWKKRHKKRRVFTPEFASAVERSLKPEGFFHLASDVEEYFQVMTQIVADLPGFREHHRSLETGAPVDGVLLTNFERKARARGGSVWRASYRRIATGYSANGTSRCTDRSE